MASNYARQSSDQPTKAVGELLITTRIDVDVIAAPGVEIPAVVTDIEPAAANNSRIRIDSRLRPEVHESFGSRPCRRTSLSTIRPAVSAPTTRQRGDHPSNDVDRTDVNRHIPSPLGSRAGMLRDRDPDVGHDRTVSADRGTTETDHPNFGVRFEDRAQHWEKVRITMHWYPRPKRYLQRLPL
ncbi:hypothetical protein AB0F85_25050 [Nocardia fluminea]|uniref:hypothetical protein n=1 Tax=Nocardia fluminea TaxID=134984 RepID=UPI0033C4F688